MLSFDRILFPTDFSEPDRRGALSHAAHLADHHGAVLYLFHVRSPDEEGDVPDSADVPSTQAELTEYAQRAVIELGLPAPTNPENPALVQESRVAGSVRTAVVGYAEEHAVDLIVMGTARRHGLRSLFPRSTAAAVVRHAPCPVLTVLDEPDTDPGPIDHIFVPYDFSEYANRAVQYAERLAALYEAEVTLVHVIEEPTIPTEYGVEVPDLDVQSVRSRTRAALQGVSDEEHQILVASGPPARRVVELAAKRSTDLIVLATHGRTGLRRMLLGSVAEQVIREAPCPVFTVKAFEDERGPSSTDEDPPDDG